MNGFRAHRKSQGLTQKQVAKALGFDRSTIARAERGEASAALMRAAWEWSGGKLTINDFAKPEQRQRAPQ